MKKMIGRKVGLLMGGGTREINSEAQLLYVTTGYLVQKLAHVVSPNELEHLTLNYTMKRWTDA